MTMITMITRVMVIIRNGDEYINDNDETDNNYTDNVKSIIIITVKTINN